jgi:formate hydrogenlyase subunit 6/NADH:ubiquinone oxidoreductase subunit I
MTNDEVYSKLAVHLDNLPGGFPPTESGVEVRILRRLFNPGEAELALHLTLIPEEPKVLARRIKKDPEETAKKLEEMAKKGLIYRIESEEKPTKFMASQYVIGIWEFHVNDLDEELIHDMNEYIPHLFKGGAWDKVPQLRTVPVDRSIPVKLEVMSYEKAEDLVRSQKKFLVAPCICRREHKMVGKGCKKPEESCLVFGRGVDYYLSNGLGRAIDLKETLEILQQADKKGLVLQPSNAKKIVNICCCCGCCCQVLKNLKRQPHPASLVSSPFIATLDTSQCEGCGACVKRCQMEAMQLAEDKAVLDSKRCIGCGLCVSTCRSGSLRLVRKPDAEQKEVPRNFFETYYKLGKARGKLDSFRTSKIRIKSKVDRILS